MLKRVLLICLVCIPVAFWTLYKPTRVLAPPWFTEGMTYSFSEDPRPDLAETFQRHRAEFEEWYRAVGEQRLWVEARKLYR